MILGNDYVDLAPLFQAHSTRNYLLSTLDFTDSVGVTSHKVAVSQLVESNESLFNKETSRFSSEHNVTKEGANKQVISSQADSLIKISRIWADFFPANTSNQPV